MPESNHRLRIIFTNGEKGIYDCSHLLDFRVFCELRDATYCSGAHTVRRVWQASVVNPHLTRKERPGQPN